MPKQLVQGSEEEQFVGHVQAASGLLARMLFRAVALQGLPPQQVQAVAGPVALTVKEAYERMKIGRSTFYKLLRTDLNFPEAFEIAPGLERYSLADIDAYIARQKEGR